MIVCLQKHRGLLHLSAMALAALISISVSAAPTRSADKPNKTISLNLDLQRLASPGSGRRGNVLIRRVTDERRLSPAGNPQVENPTLLVGQYRRSSTSTSDVVLTGGKDVTDLARETIEIALTKAGYSVVQPNSIAAADAAAIDLRVDRFWIEYDPKSGNNSKSFDCDFAFTLESNDEPFSRISSVTGSGFRNGSRPRSAKSYSNTLQHSLKSVLKNFEARHNAALKSPVGSLDSSEASKVERISQAHELLDEGAITEAEYEALKKKILAE